MSSSTTRLLSLPTGTAMEVVDNPAPAPQPPTRRVVVFVPGGFHAAWAFHFFQPWFAARGYQTHAISLRHSGASRHEAQQGLVTLDQLMADISALCDAVSPDSPVTLVAHSFGAYIAQKLLETTDRPHRFAALVLLGGAAPREILPGGAASADLDGPERVVDDATKRRAMLDRAVARDVDLCRLMYFSPTDTPGFDPAIEGDDVLRGYMPRLDSDTLQVDPVSLSSPINPRADGAAPPVLVVAGSLDVVQDRWRMNATARLWGGEALWIENAPHNLMLYSGWQDVATKVANWLEK